MGTALVADAVMLGAGAYRVSDGIRRQEENRGIVNNAFNGFVGPAEVFAGVASVVFVAADLAQALIADEPLIIAQFLCRAESRGLR